MTKARDISSLIGSSGQIDNTKITLDANEIPNLDTAKITTGTFADATNKANGNQKLLDLGLTQAEATALTGYTPPVAE